LFTRFVKAAKGGAMDYIVGGKATRGFTFVACPADYRNSGVMTFIVDNAGWCMKRISARRPATSPLQWIPTIPTTHGPASTSRATNANTVHVRYRTAILQRRIISILNPAEMA
jgi:hypothetical protein